MPAITIASPPDIEAVTTVTEGLRADLAPRWGTSGRRDFSIALRDDDGPVIGGVVGHVAWGWLYLDRVWVRADHRGRGHGAALMAAAEAIAREAGCAGVHLDTFGDDALPFYLRLGYEVWGTLDGLPPGGCKHALRKRLAPSGA